MGLEMEMPPSSRRGYSDDDNTGEEDEDSVPPSNKVKNEKFRNICSEILENFMYLGSDLMARNKEVLLSNGITHVINCSADYSPNYHPEDFEYKAYHLKDHLRENIECIFYDAIQFID